MPMSNNMPMPSLEGTGMFGIMAAMPMYQAAAQGMKQSNAAMATMFVAQAAAAMPEDKAKRDDALSLYQTMYNS